MDWSKYPNFRKSEFDCKETGENGMTPEFMERLQALRTEFGRPMRISSGFRSSRHSIERAKAAPGEHCFGQACDVAVSGADAYRLLELAIKHGFTRIGVNQKGGGRFLHLGTIQNARFPSPALWSY